MAQAEDKKYPRLSSLTALAFQFNGALQGGNHGVTFEDVYKGLDDGSLWDMLNPDFENFSALWARGGSRFAGLSVGGAPKA